MLFITVYAMTMVAASTVAYARSQVLAFMIVSAKAGPTALRLIRPLMKAAASNILPFRFPFDGLPSDDVIVGSL
jgi:hypothetical protein